MTDNNETACRDIHPDILVPENPHHNQHHGARSRVQETGQEARPGYHQRDASGES